MEWDKKLYELYEKFGKGEDLNPVFLATNMPIPYKDLMIYPVKTLYYMFFHTLAQVFFTTKYDSGLPECMGMNMLQFLFYQNQEKGVDNPQQYLPMLECLLCLCLQISELDEKGNHNIGFYKRDKKCFIAICGKEYNWQDYEKLRTIIAEQNSIELIDYKIHPDIRKKILEKDKLLAKQNKRKIGSFEELVDSLMLAGGYSEEYILNLPIRRFTNLLQRYDIMKHYDLMTILSPNLEKKDRENILRWNGACPKQDQFKDKVQNAAEIEKAINSAN